MRHGLLMNELNLKRFPISAREPLKVPHHTLSETKGQCLLLNTIFSDLKTPSKRNIALYCDFDILKYINSNFQQIFNRKRKTSP